MSELQDHISINLEGYRYVIWQGTNYEELTAGEFIVTRSRLIEMGYREEEMQMPDGGTRWDYWLFADFIDVAAVPVVDKKLLSDGSGE